MKYLFALFICYSVLFNVHAKSKATPCFTPFGVDGKCVSVFECKPLVKLFSSPNMTQVEVKLLKDSHCGFEDQSPKVCCPDPCFTPQGRPGECITLESCPHLAKLLQIPEKPGAVDFVRKSRCIGPYERSVCCGPPIPPPKVGSCATNVTAFPPDPSSGCCGVDSRLGNKIVGGNETSIDQYPWLVVIEYVKLGVHKLLCGGSLISGKYVLTAGHCVKGSVLEKGTPKYVRLGEFDTLNEGPDCVTLEDDLDCTYGAYKAPIEKTIPHPEYKPFMSRKHDIALIRLKNLAPYSEFIRPICLPPADYTESPPEEFNLFVAGWGAFSNEKKVNSITKQHVHVPYVLRQTCNENYQSTEIKVTLWKGQICAGGERGKDSCNGDSGGPLMYENGKTYEAIGVVSFGTKLCGTEDKPGVYTNVYEYLPWIKSTIIE